MIVVLTVGAVVAPTAAATERWAVAVFPSGAELIVEEYNPPCKDMSTIQGDLHGVGDTAFSKASTLKRGVVGVVEAAGRISAGDEVTVAKVKAFAKEAGINYPLTLVSDKEELRKVPQFEAFPTTLFIDKGGNVRLKEVGYRDLRTLRALVSVLEAEEAVAPAKTPASSPKGDDWF